MIATSPSHRGRRAPQRWARVAYVGLLVLALLSPFEFRLDLAFAARRLLGAFDLSLTPGDVVDGVRNLVLFAGWGLLWVTTGRADTSNRRRLLGALVTGAMLSVSAEVAQSVLPIRRPSALDVLTNSAGAWGGAVAGLVTVRGLEVWRDRPSLLGVPMYAVAGPYLAAVLTEAAFPLLRHAGPPGSYGGPLRRAAWSLEQLRWDSFAVLPVTDVLLFAPAGIFLALALRELQVNRRDALRWTVAAGIAVAVAGELAHAPLGREMELGPLLLHAAAVAGGGWLGVHVLAEPARTMSGRRRTVVFLAGYAALLCLWSARPFVPETSLGGLLRDLSPSRWLPLEALGGRRDLYTVSDVVRSFLTFLPVGAVLAVRPVRDDGLLRGLGPAVGLALGVEFLQVFVAGRFFDVTDAIIAFAGAGVAWYLVQEAGLRKRGVLLEKRGVLLE